MKDLIDHFSQQALGGTFRPHEKGCLGVSWQDPQH